MKFVSVALLSGYEFHRLWGCDSVPDFCRVELRHRSLTIPPKEWFSLWTSTSLFLLACISNWMTEPSFSQKQVIP